MKRWMVLAVWLMAVVSACNPARGEKVKMAPVSQLSPQVQKAPATVREAYQFAIANPELLKQVPCYCGCGSIGHTSNLACYVQEFEPDGTAVLDDHALGCSLCVDIARDVMRLHGEGKPIRDIRAEIVATYSKFGPPNQ